MDTSEKYIRMCSLAKEIQRRWIFQSGDFVYNPAFEKVEVLPYPGNNSIDYIWLPRQDQLQEICIAFFMHNLRIPKFEAFLQFLEWYSGALDMLSNMDLRMEMVSLTPEKNFFKPCNNNDALEKMGRGKLSKSSRRGYFEAAEVLYMGNSKESFFIKQKVLQTPNYLIECYPYFNQKTAFPLDKNF